MRTKGVGNFAILEMQVLGAKESTEGLLEGCAPSVQYALRRLVRGLGSSREVLKSLNSKPYT